VPALADDGDQPRLGQLRQMPARRLRRDARMPGELARRQRPPAISATSIAPARIAERRNDLGDGSSAANPLIPER
jgi:hypothetical protein